MSGRTDTVTWHRRRVRRDAPEHLYELGVTLSRAGDHHAAERAFLRTVEAYGASVRDLRTITGTARASWRLLLVRDALGRAETAVTDGRRATLLWEEALELPGADHLAITKDLARCYTDLGQAELHAGKRVDALEHSQRAVTLAEVLEADGHPQGSTELGTARHNVALVLLATGRLAGAATVAARTVALRTRLSEASTGITVANWDLADSLLLSAEIHQRLGNTPTTTHLLDTATEIADRLGLAGATLLARIADLRTNPHAPENPNR
jgi:tetratricopeptide (TPR) repeat protein